GGLGPEERAPIRHEQEVVGVADEPERDAIAVALARLDADEPDAAAVLDPVLLEVGPLAVAVLAHRQDGAAAGLLHGHADHDVALAELDAAHAGGAAAHRPDLLLVEPERHALLGAHDDMPGAVRDERDDERVALVDADPDDPALSDVRVRHQVG